MDEKSIDKTLKQLDETLNKQRKFVLAKQKEKEVIMHIQEKQEKQENTQKINDAMGGNTDDELLLQKLEKIDRLEVAKLHKNDNDIDVQVDRDSKTMESGYKITDKVAEKVEKDSMKNKMFKDQKLLEKQQKYQQELEQKKMMRQFRNQKSNIKSLQKLEAFQKLQQLYQKGKDTSNSKSIKHIIGLAEDAKYDRGNTNVDSTYNSLYNPDFPVRKDVNLMNEADRPAVDDSVLRLTKLKLKDRFQLDMNFRNAALTNNGTLSLGSNLQGVPKYMMDDYLNLNKRRLEDPKLSPNTFTTPNNYYNGNIGNYYSLPIDTILQRDSKGMIAQNNLDYNYNNRFRNLQHSHY